MRVFSQLFCILMFVALSGCSSFPGKNTVPDAPVRSLNQTPSCCDSLSELGYKQLPANFKARLYIDSTDPVVSLDTGKSYVEAIALPDTEKPILLQIESFLQFRGNTSKPEIFFPAVTLLNEQFTPIAALHDLPFSYERPIFRPNRLRVVATLDGRLSDAKYVLIHTTDERRSQGMSSQFPHSVIKLKRFDTMIYTNPATPHGQIRFSDLGKINVLAYSM
ncbi:MAG: MalM family protein [Pseudomonadota bacterium]